MYERIEGINLKRQTSKKQMRSEIDGERDGIDGSVKGDQIFVLEEVERHFDEVSSNLVEVFLQRRPSARGR